MNKSPLTYFTIDQVAEIVNSTPAIVRSQLSKGNIIATRAKVKYGFRAINIFLPEQVQPVIDFFNNRGQVRLTNRLKRVIKNCEDKLVYDKIDDKEDPTMNEILNNPDTQWFTINHETNETTFTGSIVALKRLLSSVNLKTVTDYPYIGFLVMPDKAENEE